MERTGQRACLFAAAVVVALTAVSGAAVAVLGGGPQAQFASCTAEPTSVAPGEPVTLDASVSDASYVEFDEEGDGDYEHFDDRDFVVEVTYETPGTYDPVVRAGGDSASTDPCGTVTVEETNEPPSAALSVSPTRTVTGRSVAFDASASSDPDGSIDEYLWDFDGDGSADRTTDTATTDFTYARADTYVASVTVVDDDGDFDSATRDVVVEEQVVAECTAEPATVAPGETVTIDATGSENADFVDYDTDGDGEYEVFEETEFTLEWQYETERIATPGVRVYSDDREDTADCDTVTVEEGNEPPEPALSISPRPGVVGRPVTFDASASTDPDGRIVEYRWDYRGDGTIDDVTSTATTTVTFQQTGSYVGTVTVVDDDGESRRAEADFRVREPGPEVRCTADPATVTPGEEVRLDARESTDVGVVDYDADGDGEYELLERTDLATTVVYEEPGTYEPRVRVHGGDRVADCGPVTVGEPNEPPVAAFTVDPSTPSVDEAVDIDASNSTDPDGRIVEYRWDLVGDGSLDLRTNSTFVEQTYRNASGYTVTLTVVDDDGATNSTSRAVVVEASESGGIPLWPLGVGGGGLLGLGGLLWYFFGSGGGGASQMPTPKPKPTPGTDDRVRYETGVFALPTASGSVSVPVGFDPDLVLLHATNGARTDTAVDRTAGGSLGLAHRSSDGLTNQCLTVADDARSTDQATCAVADDLALQLVRHEDGGPPGRVTARVTATTATGFDLDVTVPGDDPLAGGVRVLYQAFRTGSAVDVEVGHFRTPTEPGTQTVDLGIQADHVSLSAASAVADTDQLWTTDRGVGLTVGNAVAADVSPDRDGSHDQAAWGTSAWPGTGHTAAAACEPDGAFHLLYQDADRLAGRTTAAVTGLGETLRLQYDRVYNGPHKLGSTARHPVSYLAMAGGERMRPAVGVFEFPREGETRTVDCGFEPAMVELVVTAAPIGEEASRRAASRPFDVSHGTAIDTGGGLRQYVLHHSVVAEPPAARTDVPAADAATEAGETAADGGRRQRGSRTGPGSPPGDERGGRPSGEGRDDAPVGDIPAGDAVGDVPPADVPSSGPPEAGVDTGSSQTAPDPKETMDDRRAGLWLPQAPDGTVLGRDELRVTGLTATGFGVTVESVDTDGRSGNESRPAVVYRAWPAVDGERGSDASDGGPNGPAGPGPSHPGRDGTLGRAEESTSGGASPRSGQGENHR